MTCSHVKSEKAEESISTWESIHLRLSNSECDLKGPYMVIFRLSQFIWKVYFQQQTRFVWLETPGLCCAGLTKQVFLSVCSKRLFDSHPRLPYLLHPLLCLLPCDWLDSHRDSGQDGNTPCPHLEKKQKTKKKGLKRCYYDNQLNLWYRKLRKKLVWLGLFVAMPVNRKRERPALK